ncbi:MAG TPA: glycosyltransferase family 2 protein [Candidatus Deferrimicrobiaceae bacterium]|jgi:cellulose synthase/poly-beta-1,6-N-acetylglucosamine synthase-like glycosyltransferase|nr:glycosyltransferase family 2 protein [Candidatus Deferrimicrobiaceae bacterium]
MTWIFWVSAVLIAYTYVGYAAWLWLQAQLFPWPVMRMCQELPISIVMVVRNEERVLEDKLRNLLSLDYPPERCQIVIVSDGSTDRTEEILRHHLGNPRVQAVMNQLSRGKASGLNDAFNLAHGDLVVFTDARQKIEPGALRVLVESFADPNVGCVSGELMLGDLDSGETGRGMGLYWRIEKQIRELEAASGSVVGATGALYAVRRELLTAVPEGTILDDVYIPLQVVKQGKRVVFEPRARAWDSPDLGGGLEFARKVRTLSGNYQLVQLMPWVLSGDNPVLLRFVSHKLLRLLAPFALVAMFFSSLWLKAPLYRIALILQLAFYGLGVVALARLLKRGPVARAADAAATFVLLNTAAVVAFANFISGRKAAWSR